MIDALRQPWIRRFIGICAVGWVVSKLPRSWQ